MAPEGAEIVADAGIADATLGGMLPTPARRALTRPLTLLALLVVAAVALRIPLLGASEIDYDEGTYWESLRSMAAGHPLFSQVYSSQPPGFLAVIYPFYLLGQSLVAARAGILVFFAVALAATYVATRSLIGERAALMATLLIAVDPLMLRQSVALQADGPAVAMGVVALACAAHQPRAESRLRTALPVLAGAALAVAVQVKLLEVVAAVPVITVLYWRRRVLLGALGAALGTAVVLLPFATRLGAVWTQAVSSHISARSLDEGGWTADMRAMLAREALIAGLAVAGALVLWHRGARRVLWVLGGWLAAAVVLAATQRPLWPHHLLIAVPPLALAASGLAVVALPRALSAVAAAAAVSVLLVAGERTLVGPATAGNVAAAVAALRSVAVSGEVIITDDQFSAAQAGLDTPPELVDTSGVRLVSQPVTAADVERVAARDRVRVVYLGAGRLVGVDGLVAWLRQHYPRTVPVQDGSAVVFSRP